MKILTFLLIVFSINIYSQKNLKPGVYISEDKLEYITILNSTDFGYTSFLNESPYLYKQKKPKQTFCGSVYFSVNKKGIGTYKIKGSDLQLAFSQKEEPLDSIIIKRISRGFTKDSILVNFKIKTYNYREVENRVLGVSIKSKDGTIETNTNFENNKVIKLNKNQFPITFIINEGKTITLEKPKTDYLIFLFFNSTKIGKLDKLENKSFSIEKLIKVEPK